VKHTDALLSFPCGRDFAAMGKVDGGRLCTECHKVVHDLSSLSETDAGALMGSRDAPRLCVRYLYDESGRIVFGQAAVPQAHIVPSYRLTARMRERAVQAALLVAPLVLFEACGGAAPIDTPQQNWEVTPAAPTVGESEDAGGDEGAAQGAPFDEAGPDASSDGGGE
jgi:hypothetical protein